MSHRLATGLRHAKPLTRLPAAIAWDADHTLVRYRLGALLDSIYHGIAAHLVEEKIPWAEPWLSAPLDASWLQRGLVFEFSSGNVLKLTEKGRVARASHGTTMMSEEGCAARYPGVWERAEDLAARKRHPSFAVFMTWFDVPAVLVLARIVDAVESGAGPPELGTRDGDGEGFGWVLPDLFAAFDHVFDNVDGFRSRRGSFFERLVARPQDFVVPRPRLRASIDALRSRGVIQVLATNSHFRFADFCLRAALGDDYASLFDLRVVNCGKGGWFQGRGVASGAARFRRMCPEGWRDGDLADAIVMGDAGGGPAATGGAAGASAGLAPAVPGIGPAAPTSSPWPAPEGGDTGRLASMAGREDDPGRAAGAASVYLFGNAFDVERLVEAAPPHPREPGWSVTHDVSAPVEGAAADGAAAEAAAAEAAAKGEGSGGHPTAPPDGRAAMAHFRAEDVIEGTGLREGQGPRGVSGAVRPVVVYVGDHPRGDVQAAVDDARWLAVAVVEELQGPSPAAGAGLHAGAAELFGAEAGVVEPSLVVPCAGRFDGAWGHPFAEGGEMTWLGALLSAKSSVTTTDAAVAAEWMAGLPDTVA